MACLALLSCASAQLSWTPHSAVGTLAPAGRTDAAMAAVGDSLVVYGGRSGNGVFGDTWLFNVVSNTWSSLSLTTNPGPRFGAVWGTDASGRLIVVGGQLSDTQFFSDVWAFSTASETWSQLATSGPAPAPRGSASGGIVPGTNIMWMSFGASATDAFTDVYKLDLDTLSWSVVKDSSSSPYDPLTPHARWSHSAAPVASNRLVVFGGCQCGLNSVAGLCPNNDAWELLDATWSRVSGGDLPGPRQSGSFVHFLTSGSVASNDAQFDLLLYGGNQESRQMVSVVRNLADEFGRYDSSARTWTRVTSSGAPSYSLQGASLSFRTSDSSIFLFGGQQVNPSSGAAGSVSNAVFQISGSVSSAPTLIGSSSWFSLPVLHAIFMFASFGVMFVAGEFVGRYLRSSTTWWFKVHRAVNAAALLVAFVGFILGVSAFRGKDHFSFAHGGIGLSLILLVFLQGAMGMLRPSPGKHGRQRWVLIHRYVGLLVLLLGFTNITLGLFLIGAVVALWVSWFCLVALYLAATVFLEWRHKPVAVVQREIKG